MPVITKRLNIYGNLDELDKDFKRVVAKFKENYPEIKEIMRVDPDCHTTVDFKNQNTASLVTN